MAKFRKKPVVIEAIKFTEHNHLDVTDFVNKVNGVIFLYDYAIIKTLEGDMKANKGDWIIKGVNGEFYPCKPDIFEKTYESVEG